MKPPGPMLLLTTSPAFNDTEQEHAMQTHLPLRYALAVAGASILMAPAAAPADSGAGDAAGSRPLPGPPTWPRSPKPIDDVVAVPAPPPSWPAHPQPLHAVAASADDASSPHDGSSMLVLTVAGGSLVAAAAAGTGIVRMRRTRAGAGSGATAS